MRRRKRCGISESCAAPGTLESRGMGRAGYEFDGYLMRPGEVVASGEIRMAADVLSEAFGRRDLSLRTDDG